MEMIFLADFSVIKPDLGLLFWTSLIFLLFWFLIGKFAFKPIAEALKQRETDIQGALDEANNARLEMANLKAENEAILNEAREERTKIIRDAKVAGENIVKEAREEAKEQVTRLTANAKLEIDNMRKEAAIDLKNQVGSMAIEIAEKVIGRELNGKADQEKYVADLTKDITLN